METPFKRITLYDLETGGLSHKYSSITEFAGVAIDNQTLEIIEEFSVVLKPRISMKHREDTPLREAKILWKDVSEINTETRVKFLRYKGEDLTLKNIDVLEKDIEIFWQFLDKQKITAINWKDYKALLKSSYKDIVEVYFNRAYSREALNVTHITVDILEKEGVEYEEFFKQIKNFFDRHKVGNNKPILAGHNIKKFDNPILKNVFEENGCKLEDCINDFMIDTLEWVRLRWNELSSYSLGVCANELGLTLKEAHRALPDAIANAKVLIKLMEGYRGNGTIKKEYKRKKFKLNY